MFVCFLCLKNTCSFANCFVWILICNTYISQVKLYSVNKMLKEHHFLTAWLQFLVYFMISLFPQMMLIAPYL